MSCWQGPMVRMLRFLIGDEDGTTYSDDKLEEIIVYSAYAIQQDLIFANTYTINPLKLTISPDPVDSQDVAFVNLSCLKAACMLSRNELKIVAKQVVSWKDGQSSMDTTGRAGSQKIVTDNICNQYEEAKLQHQLGDNAPGKAILGPFSSDRIWTDGNWGGYSCYDRRQ